MTINDFQDFLYYDYRNMKIAINDLSGTIANLNALLESKSDPEIKALLSDIREELETLIEIHDNFPNVARNW